MLVRAVRAVGRSATEYRQTFVGHRDLNHLQGHATAMVDDLRADRDQLHA